MDVFLSIFFAILGCLMVIFRARFARMSISFQNKVFGFRFGKQEEEVGKWFLPLVGAVFIIFGAYGLIKAI